MSWKKINQLFNFEKGILQSTKCIEGKYNFITAAADWKTHNEYSHNCEALIFAAAASGSLGRTHYVNGKFISSDLCFILTPKDPIKLPVDLKFYHIIFNLYKSEIVAATKAGTSKEAIGLKVFGEYELPYFDISIQQKVKSEFGKAVAITNDLFDEYSHQLTLLDSLNQAILQEAVQGKLVPQDPKESVHRDVLINQIEEDKTELIIRRKYKPLIATERLDIKELCFKIPKNWQWFRLGEVAFFQEGPGIRVWQFAKSGVKLLNVQNILKDDTVDYFNSDKYVSESEFNEKYKHFQIEDGDILWASSGASWGKIAWHQDPGFPIMLNTSTIRLKFLSEYLYDPYLFYFLKTEFFKVQMIPQLMGMQPNFGATHLSRTYIPLPPLSEQKRIVAEIEKQFAKTKELKEHIIANQQATEQLLKALLHQAFEVKETEKV